METFILYNIVDGTIKGSGSIDKSVTKDGSTILEFIETKLINNTDLRVLYFTGFLPNLIGMKINEVEEIVEDQQLKDDIEAETLRVIDIEAEKESAGLKKITVTQAHDKIDQIFDGVTTVAALRTATVLALKKIIPFII